MPRAELPPFIRVEPGKSPECYRDVESRPDPTAREAHSAVVGWSFGPAALRHEVASMQQWIDLNA